MKRVAYLIYFLQLSCYAQTLNQFYTSFSSNNREYRIRFLNNSAVEFQNIPRHMSKNISFITSYYIENKKIIIDTNNSNFHDRNNLKTNGLEFLIERKLILTKNKKELIDEQNKTVYVSQKKLNRDFIRRKKILIIDGKKTLIDSGIVNGYGIFEKLPKNNDKILSFVNENLENPTYNYKELRGLEAYKNYGILGINGVNIYTKID